MSNHDRKPLLQYKGKSLGDRVQMVTMHHPVLNDLKKILKKHIPILNMNPRLAKVFKEPAMTALRPSDRANQIGECFAQLRF